MDITSSLVSFVILFLSVIRGLVLYLLIAWIVLRWFSRSPNQFGLWLNSIVLPLLKPFRWARIGMIDLAPIVFLLVTDFSISWISRALSTWFL